MTAVRRGKRVAQGAGALEAASMAALAGMQRRLLAAGGARVRVRPVLATTLAAFLAAIDSAGNPS
jgi:multidrug efflux pump subunit AcrB